MESARICYKQTPRLHLHQHQSLEQSHGAHQPGYGSIPSPALLCKGSHWVLVFQDGLQDSDEPVSYLITKANFTPLQEVVLSLVFLPPPILTASCSWASLSSMPDHSSVRNYHCWAVIISISLSQLKYDFFLASYICFLLHSLVHWA